MNITITAILLGIVEGATEFLPVSSTGHLIMATEAFGYDPAQWAQFNVVIQLGAILAVVVQYFGTFRDVGIGFVKREPVALRFVRNIAVAFLPAAVIGLFAKDAINVMLESPLTVAWAWLIGGVLILALEKRFRPTSGEAGVAALPLKTAVIIGFVQCLAMVPGVSRSGATIMGGLALGVDRKTAAEFSFFLAVPTMIGAATLKIVSEPEKLLSGGGTIGWGEIAIGFITAFAVALLVIRAFVAYVGRFGFTPFAWYRIVIGVVAIAWLTLR